MTFGQFVAEVKENVLPDGDSARLSKRHRNWIIDILIELQRRATCYQNHQSIYSAVEETAYECGASKVPLGESVIKRVDVADIDNECIKTGAYGVSERTMRGAMANFMLQPCQDDGGIIGSVAPPTSNYPSGQYTTELSVELSTITEGASIYWTTDPNAASSEFQLYTLPIAVTETTTLRAYAAISGRPPSQVVSWVYTLVSDPIPLPQLPQPTFSPPSGTFAGSVLVTIICPGAEVIRYTLNGFPPDETSALYTGPLLFTAHQTLRARGFAAGYTPSLVGTASYEIVVQQVAPVVVTPPSGTEIPAGESLVVTAVTATPDATIYYTLDGSEPTDASFVFTGFLTVDSTSTLKFKAYKAGMGPSIVTTVFYPLESTAVTGWWGSAGPTPPEAAVPTYYVAPENWDATFTSWERTQEAMSTTPFVMPYPPVPTANGSYRFYIAEEDSTPIQSVTADGFSYVPADFAGTTEGFTLVDGNGYPYRLEVKDAVNYRMYRFKERFSGALTINVQHS